jgi:hypothetical protein
LIDKIFSIARFFVNLIGVFGVCPKRSLPAQIKSLKGTLRKVRVNTQQPRPSGVLIDAPDYLSPGARAARQCAIQAAPPELLKRLDISV